MAITNGYATLTQVKAALRISDNTDDTLLEGVIESASRLIDGFAMRNFYQSGTVARLFTAVEDLYVQTDDIAGPRSFSKRAALRMARSTRHGRRVITSSNL